MSIGGFVHEHLFYNAYWWKYIQWSLYFKTANGTKKMWSYIAGGLKIKVI